MFSSSLVFFLLVTEASAGTAAGYLLGEADQKPSAEATAVEITGVSVIATNHPATLSNSNQRSAEAFYVVPSGSLPLVASGGFTNGVWQVRFDSGGSNNVYSLERSTDMVTWTAVSDAVVGSNQPILLQDTNPPPTRGFYRVRATRGTPSLSATSGAAISAQAGPSWAHVQTAARNSAAGSNVLAFTSATGVGDLIVVEVDWSGGYTFTSVSDSQSNVYTQIGAEQSSASVGVKSRLYYAKNIKGGVNTVTTVVSGSPAYHELYIHEYSGLSLTAPLDAYSVKAGNSSSFTSGNVRTTSTNELLYGLEIDSNAGTASAGWTTRTTLDSNVAADKNIPTAGTTAFTGNSSGAFIAWVAAFKAAGGAPDTSPPTVPTNLIAVAISSSQINLSWAPSTDNVGVAGYGVYRNGNQVNTSTAASFSDVGLAAATLYTYSVSAFDAAGNVSPQSVQASATTQALPGPVINSFSASPASITAGQTAALSWNVSNAVSLSLDNGIGDVTGSSSIVVSPGATTTYTLTATNAGGSAVSQTTVTVNPTQAPDTTPPAVSIVSPSSNVTVSGSAVTISASASDPTVAGQLSSGVAGVQFTVDGRALGAELVAAPYSLVWDTTAVPDGSHMLGAVARDAAGNSTNATGVPVTVNNTAPRSYATTFPGAENPIYENGNWINGGVVGLDWSNCATAVGVVQGRQNNGSGPSYNDSTALLTGTWGSNQTVTATLYRGSVVENDYPEVELRLRSSLSAHSCTGYEIMWSLRTDSSCYVAIARWNGPFGNFSGVASVSGSQCVITNGSILKATITGSTITAYINGSVVLTGTDTTYVTGNPGIGFDHNGPSSEDSGFGFTSFSASSDAAAAPDTTPPSTPTGLSAAALSSSQISLSWNASVDNVGVAGYKIYRGGLQVGTAGSTTYSDSGLSPSTSYTYSVSAFDAAGNNSAQSTTASATTTAQVGPSWAHVQTAAMNSAAGSNALPFTSATGAGDLIVVEVDWSGGYTFTSVSDSQGNVYTQIGAEQSSASVGVKSRLYYARNIRGGANTVTTVVSGSPAYHELFIHEYSGLSLTAPLDAYSVNVGSSSTFTSGTLTTTSTNELLYGLEIDSNAGAASAGWTTRATLDSNVAADKNLPVAGTTAFTGTSSGAFIAWVAAFK